MVEVAVIAGGAGFIGSNLAKKISKDFDKVIVLDNFLLGNSNYVSDIANILVIKCDLHQAHEVDTVFQQLIARNYEIKQLWHLAANSDISKGVDDISIDFDHTFLTTLNLLNACKTHEIKNFLFASSSAVYGNKPNKHIRETDTLEPISNYGAFKACSEMLVQVFTNSCNIDAKIFRFPNVVGAPATHGVIYDFVRKLTSNDYLTVLGNGTQQKCYLHVDDLVAIMLQIAAEQRETSPLVVNVGPDDNGISVKEIAEMVRDRIKPECKIIYGEGNIGWVGDVSRFRYDVSYLSELGCSARLQSKDAVSRALEQILKCDLSID